MTLHGDRPAAISKDDSKQTGTPLSPSAASRASSKRPASPASPHSYKKAKSDGVSPKPSPSGSGSDRVRTVIEVLNTPRIQSPLSRATSSAASSKHAEVQEKAKMAASSSAARSPGNPYVPAAEAKDPSQQARQATLPVPLIQTDAAADAVLEASDKEGDAMRMDEAIETREASEAATGDGDVVMAEREKA